MPSFPRKRESILEEFVIEIPPFGICLFYQLYFPEPGPFFDLFFLDDCRFRIFVLLIPHQHFQTVLCAEAGNDLLFVLGNALWKIRRYADIERTSGPIGEYVDAELF
jgi:hypothetical protein